LERFDKADYSQWRTIGNALQTRRDQPLSTDPKWSNIGNTVSQLFEKASS
jgi:hypothetical protein